MWKTNHKIRIFLQLEQFFQGKLRMFLGGVQGHVGGSFEQCGLVKGAPAQGGRLELHLKKKIKLPSNPNQCMILRHRKEPGPERLGSSNEARGAGSGEGSAPAGRSPPRPRTDYSSQLPSGRAGAAAALASPCAGAAGSCSRGRGEDGVQGEPGAAAGEEYRGPVLSLRAQRGEHQVRGQRGRPWPALSGLPLCKRTGALRASFLRPPGPRVLRGFRASPGGLWRWPAAPRGRSLLLSRGSVPCRAPFPSCVQWASAKCSAPQCAQPRSVQWTSAVVSPAVCNELQQSAQPRSVPRASAQCWAPQCVCPEPQHSAQPRSVPRAPGSAPQWLICSEGRNPLRVLVTGRRGNSSSSIPVINRWRHLRDCASPAMFWRTNNSKQFQNAVLQWLYRRTHF